jgi:pro-apoptotic serine protease NMA111
MSRASVTQLCRLALLVVLVLPALRPVVAFAGKDPWTPTLERVSRAVLAITVSQAHALDTDDASSSSGTGFIVDLEHGIVLTNRHMVHVGPIRAKGITLDHEEVELKPIYRDPLHDFGFYQFDPKTVRYMNLAELPLAPEEARVGSSIRIVGNDAGEKLSILDGTLARLDRPAPDYGTDTYNDYDTFYYQAATSTSGGSSGSPVVDVQGRVLAINAGGRRDSATSYYLPVRYPALALQHILKNEPISRGTLESVYTYEPYNELRRLGLRAETEALFRKGIPAGTGMLVVREVVEGSPEDGLLRPGDILVRIDGELASDFVTVESRLDARVGQKVRLDLERGGTPVTLDLPVGSLDALQPSHYVEFSQGVLQETSMQVALNSDVPASGVLVVDSGYALARGGVGNGSIILALDDHEIRNLEDLRTVLAAYPDGQRVRARYKTLAQPDQEEVDSFIVDRHWAPMRDCHRNDKAGRWDCTTLAVPPHAPPEADHLSGITFESVRDPVASVLAPSLCHVRFTIPYWTEGVAAWAYVGAGIVVDAEKGLVLTDRGTVPVALGDAEITFASTVRVPARVVWLHPVHNVALLQYDPKLVEGLPIQSARLATSSTLDAGDAVHQVGLTSAERVVSQRSTISRVDPTAAGNPDPPAFREYNSEALQLVETAPSIGGVLADDKGQVLALWAFNPTDSSSGGFMGLPIELANDVIAPLKAGKKPVIPDLAIEATPIPLKAARDQGVPDDWIARLSAADPERRRALSVVRTLPGTQAADLLKGGDIVLSINDKPVTRLRQLETFLPKDLSPIKLLRVRDGKVEEVQVRPVALDGQGITEVLSFAGALFHRPHRQALLQADLKKGGLYVSWYWYGAPAALSALKAAVLVRTVNEQPVNDIDDLINQVRPLGDLAPVRLGIESLRGMQDVVTLETDLLYWPAARILQDPVTGDWRWELLSGGSTSP